MSRTLFERCYLSAPGASLLEKAERLNAELNSNPPEYYDGLRMVLLESAGPETLVRMPDGRTRKMLMFGSNSFLNLNRHPAVIEAEKRAYSRYGCGAGSPPLYAGQTDVHEELETELAKFTGCEAALLFPSGYSGNLGVISGLCRPGDVVLADSSNHASLVDGARLSGAEVRTYLHRSPDHLETILRTLPENRRGRLLVSDGVFSMEGSLAPVDKLAGLAGKYGCLLMIDDAHGFWAVGENGRGTASVFHERERVALHYGTFSKALGSVGGFCAGPRALIDYLKYYGRSYFFSSALPATVAAGVLASIRLLEREPEIIARLQRNRDFFQHALESLGFDTLDSRSAIIPVLIGDDVKLGNIQMELFEAGIFTNIGTTPAINRRRCRLRMNVMATHTEEQLERAVSTLARIGRKYGVIV